MTVVVQCFHCNAILELDEGFRGGVCRCSACGSLLQVPRAPADGQPARKVRPAVPPAPRGTAAKGADDGAGPAAGSPLVTGPGSADFGGSSSGLGRIHKTRPISGGTTRKIPPAQLPAESHESLLPPPPPPRAPAHGLPELRAARRNRFLFWMGILLIAAIAVVSVSLVMQYMIRSEHTHPAHPRTIPAPATPPSAPTPQPQGGPPGA